MDKKIILPIVVLLVILACALTYSFSETNGIEDKTSFTVSSEGPIPLSEIIEDIKTREYYEGYDNETLAWMESLGDKQVFMGNGTIVVMSDYDAGKLRSEYACDAYITQNFETIKCNCLKQKIFNLEYNKSNIFNLSNQNFSTYKSTLYSDIVDKSKYKSDISPRENIEIIKKICINFINNFENPKEKNLLFTGNTGLGKTFLSSCIANEILKKGKTVLYQTSPIMFDTIIDYRFGKSTSNIFSTLFPLAAIILLLFPVLNIGQLYIYISTSLSSSSDSATFCLVSFIVSNQIIGI